MSTINDNDFNIGNRLKKLRGGMGQEKLSAAIKKKTGITISRQTISDLENNKVVPKLETLCTLADYFECSIDYLIGRDDCTSVDNQYIHDQLGLNDSAIKALKRYNKMDSEYYNELLKLAYEKKVPDTYNFFILPMLNFMLSNKHLKAFLERFSVMVHDTYQVPVYKGEKGFKAFPSYTSLSDSEDYLYFSEHPNHPNNHIGIKIDSDFRYEINKNLISRSIDSMAADYKKRLEKNTTIIETDSK